MKDSGACSLRTSMQIRKGAAKKWRNLAGEVFLEKVGDSYS